MNYNYCPNCGYRLTYIALASNPPIPVVKCDRCGWEMREGRAPSWDTVCNSTAVPLQASFTCVIDTDHKEAEE